MYVYVSSRRDLPPKQVDQKVDGSSFNQRKPISIPRKKGVVDWGTFSNARYYMWQIYDNIKSYIYSKQT